MKVEEFTKRVEECWVDCPANTMSARFVDEMGVNRSMQIAFMLGAGVGLMTCKAKGVDDLSVQDVAGYIRQERIEQLFETSH